MERCCELTSGTAKLDLGDATAVQEKSILGPSDIGTSGSGLTFLNAVKTTTVNPSEMVVKGNYYNLESRTMTISIVNNSSVSLEEPQWWCKHKSNLADELPPRKISKGGTASVRFMKSHFSIYGCSGLLVYRYRPDMRIAILCSVPQLAQNKATVAILDDGVKKEKKLRTGKDMYNYLNVSSDWSWNKKKGEYVVELKTRLGKWKEIQDHDSLLALQCAMSGGRHVHLTVELSDIDRMISATAKNVY